MLSHVALAVTADQLRRLPGSWSVPPGTQAPVCAQWVQPVSVSGEPTPLFARAMSVMNCKQVNPSIQTHTSTIQAVGLPL